MLTVVNLKDILKPARLLENQELEALCHYLIPKAALWHVKDGLINVTGAFDISVFVDHGKLIAPFGEVYTTVVSLRNLTTLKGMPKTVHGSVDIRSAWLESLEGCTQTAESVYVDAPHLTSLEHGPTNVKFYAVTSNKVTSLKGFSKNGITSFSAAGCKSVTTTDGLQGVTLKALGLPSGITEITEHPASCTHITAPECSGLPKLFLTEGLSSIATQNDSAVKNDSAVNEIFKQVLLVKGTRRRYLEAQTLLIDAGLDHLL